MAVGQNRLKIVNLEFFTFIMIEYHHALYWKYGTLAGLGSRPLAQVTMDSELITIFALRPFK
jgi:hypothetical protein